MKKLIAFLVVIILIAAGVYYFTQKTEGPTETTPITSVPQNTSPTTPPITNEKETRLGTSIGGNPIMAFHFGTGTDELLFVGGIHGGYEWNTTLVAYEMIDYLTANPSVIPSNVKVTVIPVLNPDGLQKVVGTTTRFTKTNVSPTESVVVSGRFNGNTVDLNRNFDCDWQANGVWQNKTVSGGSAPFSEPESKAIKAYVESKDPKAVVVWYSAAGGVFSSNCHNGVLAETKTLTNTFASASGYRAYEEWGFYEITGDMVNWLAKENIPAISVLLTNHTDTEWTKNKAGIDAVLKYYAK